MQQQRMINDHNIAGTDASIRDHVVVNTRGHPTALPAAISLTLSIHEMN